jgi:hypothetical protein
MPCVPRILLLGYGAIRRQVCKGAVVARPDLGPAAKVRLQTRKLVQPARNPMVPNSAQKGGPRKASLGLHQRQRLPQCRQPRHL